jgi:hypothetical protein
LPELSGLDLKTFTHQPAWKRAIKIWQNEGLASLIHRIGKNIQQELMMP